MRERVARFGIPIGLVALALLVHPSVAFASAHTIAKQAPACSFPVLKQLCDLGGVVTNGASAVTTGVTQDFFSALVSWVAGAAAWVVDHVIELVQTRAGVNLSGGWFSSLYLQLIVVAALCLLTSLAIV